MTTFYAIWIILFGLATGMTRGEFVTKMVNIYKEEKQVDGIAWHTPCPFTDVSGLPEACEAWELGITAGTTETTFSPNDKVEPYQAFIFVGKTMYALEK